VTMRNPKTILLVALGHVYQTVLGFVCKMALVVQTCIKTRNSLEKGQNGPLVFNHAMRSLFNATCFNQHGELAC
jgi:hypothetical protein